MNDVLLFAGTTEGRRVAEACRGRNVTLHVCVATEYGEALIEEAENVHVRVGRLNAEGVAALLRETGAMIGQCGITRQFIDRDEVFEVGYLFARAHWHRGYAVEAAAACRDWAFETLPIDELYAKVRSTNVASMNVAIRLGMTVRRTFTTHYRGIDMPHLAFALSRRAWGRTR
mgnify:CR=1 FL=1